MRLSSLIDKLSQRLCIDGNIEVKALFYDSEKDKDHITILFDENTAQDKKQYQSSEAHLFENEQRYNSFVDESMDYHDRILAETGHY